MRKNIVSKSGLFNPRTVIAVALCSLGASLGWVSFASTPSSGTLSPGTAVLTYDAPGPLVINQSPLGLGQLDSGPRCNTEFPCDSYQLNVTLPSGYVAANPNASVRVTMFWTNTDPTNKSPSDYDLYIFNGANPTVDGNHEAPYSSASQSNPEVAVIGPLADGTSIYTIKIVAYQPAGETVHVRIELLSGQGPAGFPGFGLADPTISGVPRFQIFDSGVNPSTTGTPSATHGNGEFNIGYNPVTGRIMTMNSGPVWRLTPPERLSPAKPECCSGLWENKSNTSTNNGLDPILWTDRWTDANPLPMQPASGARTFAANSTVGTNGVYAFSDNDGDQWLPLSASPPNASSDHETIGSGPYPASLSALATPANHGHAVYYCAQTFPVGAAACQRSDTYGDSYGASILPYTGNNGDPCGGIHGHVHVGPDGTVYLPVRDCGGNAGLVVSTDGGVNWTEHIIPNSAVQTHGSDPSVAIGANNTVYFFYVKGNADQSEGHVHVQVGTNHGAIWSKDTDLGAAATGQGPASHGIINAAFPEAIAGDDNRAACGFLGTDRPGFYEGSTFPGFWYLFIATTYDGGTTWNVVNATPNDPVQGLGGIWQGGGSPNNRNLLDFNEVTMDEKGRVLFGYSDGCIGTCVGDPTQNSFSAYMKVARQFGGKPLLSQFDPVEPAVPKAACLSGTRNATGVHLSWRVPDNGGADISAYRIFRGTASGNEVFIAQIGATKPSFDDITADPSQPVYYYVRAVNSVDAAGGALSNEVNFAATPGIWLKSISSRISHAGTPYDVDLPLYGPTGIECRTTGNGNYQLVFIFGNAVSSVDSVNVTSGTASVSSYSFSGGPLVVNLTGVTNAQKVGVTLTNVTDSAGNAAASITGSLGVLIGDVNSSGLVDSGDVFLVRQQTGQSTTASNFRKDVNASGLIDSGDVFITRQHTSTSLP